MNITFLDGAFGTMLQSRGLAAGETPEDWNISRPDDVRAIHREYLEAGADIVNANTFGANSLKYHGAYSVREVIEAAVNLAREACKDFPSAKVALDIGPTGRLLKPTGDLDFERAYEAFAEAVRCGVQAGADVILIETFSDTMELKAAVLAAKENSNLPIYATVALSEDGKLLTGADVECVGILFESLGIDACGFNCGLGPDKLLPFVEQLARVTSLPIAVKANAGMPKVVDGKTVFTVGPEEFAQNAARLVSAGATFIGGCCGTTPAHIAAVKVAVASVECTKTTPSIRTVVSSGCASVELKPGEGLIIGERINPTGKKKLKEAYANGDTAYVLREAVAQVDAGAEILDVNCGVPGIDEAAVLDSTVIAVQGVTTVPLQIDTADSKALETALRHVNGKPLVNSVNGKRESMDAVFPLVKKYGGAIVALCLDETGIPETSDGRIAIAKKILAEGAKYCFTEKDFVFDALTLAVSADPTAAIVTLETVKRLTEELKVNTVLGVSNVSFGLPNRPRLNNAMYTLARRAGLSAAIANPSVIATCDDEEAFDVLLGRDKNCERWIAANQQLSPAAAPAVAADTGADDISSLRLAIKRGLKADAKNVAAKLLDSGKETMVVIQEGIVPALEEVGSNFEIGKVFLPQLLMSADAAGAAFESVKAAMRSSSSEAPAAKGKPIVIATVKGDIHDIGKNIVRALLENYGFDVIDLGRDVAPETIVEAAKKSDAMMVGLSALMTTTVGAMAETIALLRKEGLTCKTCVGGAVVTQEYADEIGADFYGKDAMRTVRFAESLVNKMKRFTCIVLSGFCMSSLYAENVSTNETVELPSVVVYASRIDNAKDSIPAAVNVFDSSDIENSGASDMGTFLQKKANLFIRTMNSNPMQSQISMRGFGENSYGRVKILVDGEELNGVDMSPPFIAGIPLDSVERIEIIHGPSPVLYGDGAAAGVISVQTAADDYEKKTRVSAKAGSQYTFGANMMTKGGVFEDSVVYRASYDYLRSDGFRDRSGYELHSANAMLGKNFENGSMFRLRTNYRNAFYEMPGAIPWSERRDSRRKAAYDNDWVRLFAYGVGFDSKILLANDQWLFLDASFSRKYRKSNWGDYDYFNEYDLYEFFISPRYVNEKDMFGHANKFTFGTDLRYDLYRTKDNSGVIDSKPYFDRLRTALFAQDEFFITDELSFVAGARIENIDNRWARTSSVREHNINETAASWELGFVYRPVEDMRTWIKSTRFFRSPFCDELSYTENGEPLDPESGYSIDLGGEYKFAEEFAFDVNGYAMFIDDEIFYNPYARYYGSYWGGYNCNSPSETRRFGLDTGLSWEREKTAEASIKYGVVSAQFESGQFDGNDVPMVPNHYIRAEAGYWITSDIEVKCGYRYVGPQRFASDFNNDHEKIPGYSLFDAGLFYTPSWAEGWKASAVIDNIFDRTYCDFAGWSDYSGAYCYPACGRSFMFTMSYEF